MSVVVTRAPAAAGMVLAMALGGPLAATAPAPGGPTPDGVEARLVLPAGKITVGDPVILKLTVTHPPGVVLDYPDAARLAAPSETGPGGEEADAGSPPRFLVEEVRPVESKPPRPGETSWTIRLRPFAPGDVRLPSLTLSYRMPGSSETRSVSTAPVDLHVMSVLKGEKEEASDIKGPWWIPRALWPWILAGLAALAGLYVARLLWRRLRGRRPAARAVAAAPADPEEPAYDRALRELRELLGSGMLARGLTKEFHVRLSEIVKRFLGAHYGFDALDRTTLEVLADLSRPEVSSAVQDRARGFLEACDLVKFAKHRPGRDDIDATVGAAKGLIEVGRSRAPQPASGVAA